MNKRQDLAVVIGRFQVSRLHRGHRYLIDTVAARHERVLILVGVHSSQPTDRNPLDYSLRQRMIKEVYAHNVQPLYDKSSDEAWSEELDRVILEHSDGEGAVLYASRDSFAPHYHGQFPVEIIPELPGYSGTKERQQEPPGGVSAECFRRGVIHANGRMRYPTAYGTVDVAILHTEEESVLLGRKPDEQDWRFIGGFVDPSDGSLEAAARREAKEEVGDIEIDSFSYLTSAKIDDHRYQASQDGIMTTFFSAYYLFGRIQAGDDLEEVKWFPLREITNVLCSSHQALGARLIQSQTIR